MQRIKFSKGARCCYCNRVMLEYKPNMTPEERTRLVTRDHKIPKYLGGIDRDNLILACAKCNQLKAAIPYLVFKTFADMVLRAYPDLPTPLVRNALNLYLMHLLERAMTNKKALRDASTIAMLKLKDEIDRYEKVNA